MARPFKAGLDYFPLDCDMDTDDKIAMIEALHGIEGFGIVIKLLMKIYKNSYYYEWNERQQKLFSRRINVDINTVTEVVNDCITEGLFHQELYLKHNILTSKGIQARYLEATKRRKDVTFIGEYLLIDDFAQVVGSSKMPIYVVSSDGERINVNINSRTKEVNDNISTQSKVKESKVKKSKELKTYAQIAQIAQGELAQNTPQEIDPEDIPDFQDDYVPEEIQEDIPDIPDEIPEEVPEEPEKPKIKMDPILAFEIFWTIYPRKKDKKKAQEKFKAASKKHDPQVIIDGAEKYAKECLAKETEQEYIKLPATFLHGESFLNEFDLTPRKEVRHGKATVAQNLAKEYDLGF